MPRAAAHLVSSGRMDLRRLRHFVVLAEVRNFHKAADRLHMTQPALTVSIQKLEAEAGAALFNRDPAGITLTPVGKAALLQARRALFHSEQFLETMRLASAGRSGVLRIGFVGSTTYRLLPRLVPRFRADYPQVQLVLRQLVSTQVLEQLDDGELDIGLIRTPVIENSSCALVELERETFSVALPGTHPLVRRDTLSVTELALEPFVMYSLETSAGLRAAAMALCQQAGFMPQIAQEATQVHTILALVESGLGVALLPSVMDRFASERAAFRPLSDHPESGSIGLALAYRPDRERPAAKNFRLLAARGLD